MRRLDAHSQGASREHNGAFAWLARLAALALVLSLSACGGGGGGDGAAADDGSSGGDWDPATLNAELDLLASQLSLTGDPASSRAAAQTLPADDPLVKLGELLFFSQTLAGGYDVSCATCHHPDFAGGDGLSLGVGVAPKNASTVGPGRELDPARDFDPRTDGGPNMHRNSLTTFNVGLFDRALMYDGRFFVLDEAIVAGGHGELIKTPESGQRFDVDPVDGLLEFTMKGPIATDNEMRGYLYTEYTTPHAYRAHLVDRLRGVADTQYNTNPDAAANWLALFQDAFGQPAASADEVITIENVQRALAAYVASQIFVDTPLKAYLDGDHSALTPAAKQGALLFLRSPAEGGLGCAECHSGDRFTDESYHNMGFPQIGRGFLHADHSDQGRWIATRQDPDLYAFRTPSLLNIAVTGPYGHTGSFATLEDAIRYHANPRSAVDTYDFTLSGLDQFRSLGMSYDYAETLTRTAMEAASFDTAEALLPRRTLTSLEVVELTAFLDSLTDSCVADHACVSQWTPTADEDPDGHLLVRDESAAAPDVDASNPGDYPKQISLNFPPTTPRTTFADVESCPNGLATKVNTGELRFQQQTDPSFGLNDPHGYSPENWFNPNFAPTVEVTLIGGGVTAGYLTDDCWPDLVFTGGNKSGMVIYENKSGAYFESVPLFAGNVGLEYSGTAMVDLNGDYRREFILGNIELTDIPVFAENDIGQYTEIAALPVSRPTFGISFAPLDSTGYPYIFFSHWASSTGTNGGTSPALWKNDAVNLMPWDKQANTTTAYVDQRWNFTPKFADFTGDGLIDLVISSDFLTSSTLRNVADTPDGPVFKNETNRHVITDQNGMGSALLDLDNDGTLEWFVTSVYETGRLPLGNWGQSGNRLYRNASTADKIAFEDITDEAGVRDGAWGWGACAADVNNDGFIDLFHVNGFGSIPDDVIGDQLSQEQAAFFRNATSQFQAVPPRLFINDGDGTFTESAMQWSIDVPSEGRGLACFDYDRDGDIDIAVFDHSVGLQFFENESGSGTGRGFINVRLVGNQPNTDAIGAKVYLTANVGNGHGVQTQLRLSEANSNYNSQNPPDLHFGLGQASVVDEIRVVWPDQSELTCSNVAVNQFLVLDQRDGNAACP